MESQGDQLSGAKRKAEESKSDESVPATKAPRKPSSVKLIKPNTFEPSNHFYPRVLNAQIHPIVNSFMNLGNDRIVQRYCHLNPGTDAKKLQEILAAQAKYFRWSGADLFNVTNEQGKRQMILIETNSSPSGQKSMPGLNEDTADGYHKLMRNFLESLEETKKQRQEGKDALPFVEGGLAVIYDKNPMEATGYAAALADVSGEPVWLAEFYDEDTKSPVQWDKKGVLRIRDNDGNLHTIRACFRYVTQRPWNRIPVDTATVVLNPVVACLAGGRNKMAADKAYEFFNHEQGAAGLSIRTPETIRDVSKAVIPMWVESMGGLACIKVPYSNAGQGVYTITNADDLQAFMDSPQHYDKYIVQSLVGNSTWSSSARPAQFFHTGSIPNKKNDIYVSDLRMMIRCTKEGFVPVAIYARRAQLPLAKDLKDSRDSWGMLGTNLSSKNEKGEWDTDTNRLLLMDLKDFNRLGLSTDDLIDAYVQTVCATYAIDQVAQRLMNQGSFDYDLYSKLNDDDALISEILKQ